MDFKVNVNHFLVESLQPHDNNMTMCMEKLDGGCRHTKCFYCLPPLAEAVDKRAL